MSKPFQFGCINDLYVIAHPGETPTKDAWDRYIAHVREFLQSRNGNITGLRTLVVTDGGGPDVRQRGKLNDVLAGRSTPIAVVSANLAVRTFLAPMSWFNPEVKLFAPKDIGEALAFLKVPPDDERKVFTLLNELDCKPEALRSIAELPRELVR